VIANLIEPRKPDAALGALRDFVARSTVGR